VPRFPAFTLADPVAWRRRVYALDADAAGYLFGLLLWSWSHERPLASEEDAQEIARCPRRRWPAVWDQIGPFFAQGDKGLAPTEFFTRWNALLTKAGAQHLRDLSARGSDARTDARTPTRKPPDDLPENEQTRGQKTGRREARNAAETEQTTLVHPDLSGDLDPERASDPESAGTADRSDVRSSSRKNPDPHRARAGALDRELTALVWAAAVPLARDFWDSSPAAAMVETDRVDAFKTYLGVRGFAYHAHPDMPGNALTVVAREHAPTALPPSPIDVALETAVEALTGRDAVDLQVLSRACFDIVNEDPRWRGPDQAAFRESVLTLCYREATYRADPRFDVHADGPTVTVGLKE
jgi:hypothetical protein